METERAGAADTEERHPECPLACCRVPAEGTLVPTFPDARSVQTFLAFCKTLCISFLPTAQLKTIEIYCHTALEARSLKSGCWQDWFFPELPSKRPFPVSLPAPGGCQQSWALLGM